MKNSEILSSLKAGMSVDLANGNRYDVVCDKEGQLEIIRHYYNLGKYRSVTIGTEAAIWLPNLMLNHSQNIIAFARHAAKR